MKSLARKMHTDRFSGILWPLLLGVFLAGCMPELKSEAPPDRVYWLEASDIVDPPTLRLRLSVVPGLESDRIWLLEQDQRLNFYAGAFWPDNLRPLLESILRRSLEAHGDGPVMEVLVERFFAVETVPGEPPRVELSALLTGADGRCRIERAQVAGSTRLRDIVAAHQALLDGLTYGMADYARSGICT